MPLNEYAFIDGLEIERAKPGDLAGIDEMLCTTTPEIEKATAAHRAACEHLGLLTQTVPELKARLANANVERDKAFNAGLDEVIFNPACATGELAMSWLPKERTARFLQDALDRINYVLRPAALVARLTAHRDLLRLQSLDAALHAARNHAITQERLERSGLLDSERRVVFVSEKTELLRTAAKELHRQAQLAENQLNEELAQQTARQQLRLATGMITSAEVASAVPTL